MDSETIEAIKAIREFTGVAILDAKAVLEECDGDVERAKEVAWQRWCLPRASSTEPESTPGTLESHEENTDVRRSGFGWFDPFL